MDQALILISTIQKFPALKEYLAWNIKILRYQVEEIMWFENFRQKLNFFADFWQTFFINRPMIPLTDTLPPFYQQNRPPPSEGCQITFRPEEQLSKITTRSAKFSWKNSRNCALKDKIVLEKVLSIFNVVFSLKISSSPCILFNMIFNTSNLTDFNYNTILTINTMKTTFDLNFDFFKLL